MRLETLKILIIKAVASLIEGKFQEKLQIAKEMKASGEPVEKITRYTGLSEGEINSL